MADNFSLTGAYGTTPLNGITSLIPVVAATIDEAIVLDKKHVDEVVLGADTPVVVPFGGGVVSANIVILKAIGGPVVARMTSTAGATQSVPFDTYLILMSMTTPLTAIDLTRSPGVQTTVQVFLGQEA